jgi:3-hydroxyacyl-CoA dehydrogenase
MAQELPGAAQVRRLRRSVDEDEVRRRHRLERELFMALMFTPSRRRCATLFLAERAPARSPTCRKTRRRAQDQEGRRDRRRHDGRRHRDELPQRRHPGDDARDEAGSARPGVGIIRKNYEAQVKKGKLKQDKYEQRMACSPRRSSTTTSRRPTW